MGLHSFGGITRHLQEIQQATVLWLEWEAVQSEGDEAKTDLFLIDLAEREIGTPEQPEALYTLRRFRRFGIPPMIFSGSLYNQPHIWLQELNAAIEGELDYQTIQLANARLKAVSDGD